ncbi:MAG: hypothetical protein FD124_529 [Alphaproteobacteria bacterium]|nr:MAG: hypothetical protein FD160_2155 [Caulobacteraceae bacterium]TPW08256.1 MAG: hypothetical protein FD124_529 [Alphaproteobacteria bacterium]
MFDADIPGDPKGAAKTPPYIPWKTLITLVEDFRTNGLPPRIDNSVLRRFSGGVGSQIKSGFRSMGFMDDQSRPTPELDAFVKSYGTDAFPGDVKKMIARTYPFLTGLDLLTATPSMFADAFKEGTNAKEDVLRKCRTFFLQAAGVAGVEVGPRLANASFPRARGPAGAKKVAKARRELGSGSGGSGETPPFTPPPIREPEKRDPVEVLMSILDMDAMDDKESEAVWTLVKFLKRPVTRRKSSDVSEDV